MESVEEISLREKKTFWHTELQFHPVMGKTSAERHLNKTNNLQLVDLGL